MPTVNVDDLDLFYREWGTGPPLLLIMGFTANSDWWPEALVEDLARNFRVLSIDNRAAGRTPPGKRHFTISQAAQDAVGFLDAMGIEKTHVFGISMGGMIAQAMAAHYGNRVDHLILGCTMARPRTGFLRGLPGQAWLALQYLWNPTLRARPWIVNVMFALDFLKHHPHMAHQFIQMTQIAKIKKKHWWNQLVAMMKFNGFPLLPRIQQPTLVLVGSKDLLISPNQSRILLKHLPFAKSQILPNLGHAFVGEAPLEVASMIQSFLNPPAA